MRPLHFTAIAGALGAALLACATTPDDIRPQVAPRTHAAPAEARAHLAVALTRSGDTRSGSTVALARLAGRQVALVADEDAAEVRVVDLATRVATGTVKLPGTPGQLVVTGDGRLLVALRENAALAVYRPTDDRDAPFAEEAMVLTADEPIGLALTPDERTVLVTCGWGKKVQGFALGGGYARTFEASVAREPRAIVVSDDGTRAFVSHIAGGEMTVVDLEDPRGAGQVALQGGDEPLEEIGFGFGLPVPIMERPPEMPGQKMMVLDFAVPAPSFEQSLGKRRAAQGFALAKVHVGKKERVLAPEVLVNPGFPTVRSAGYGGGVSESAPAEVADVAVVDARSLEAEPMSLHTGGDGFDHRRFGGKACILPRAAATDEAHGTLYVACAGIDALVEYDATSDNPASTEKRRWAVGAGPTGLALDAAGGQAIAWSQMDRTVSFVPLAKGGEVARVALDAGGADVAPRTVDALERGTPAADLARGRRLFYAEGDARISADGRACASCHPDGRDDGMVWSTPDGPRQTPMLAGRLRGTAPYGWYGASDTVAKHVSFNSLHRLSGTGLPPEDLDALAAYIAQLRGPSRAPTAPDPHVERGRAIFASAEAGCSSCHTPDGSFTDGDRHDVGSAVEADRETAFDTPSLRFVAGSAPYFHDGRYATLRELLVKSDGKMGHTAQLSPADLDDLEAYLATL